MQLGLGQWQGTQKDGRSSHMAKLTECSKGLVMGNRTEKDVKWTPRFQTRSGHWDSEDCRFCAFHFICSSQNEEQ